VAALTALGPGRQPTCGVLIAWSLRWWGTLVLLKVVDLIVGIRVPEEHEIEGLTYAHGREAYNLECKQSWQGTSGRGGAETP